MVYNNLNQEILFSFKKRIVISNLFFFLWANSFSSRPIS